MNSFKMIFCVLSIVNILMFMPNTAVSLEIPLAIDSRIRTLIYSPNQIYELPISYGSQSCIEFAKGEKVSIIALGDSASWKVQQTDRRIFLRPMNKEGKTNMIIITNRHSYTFDLVARSPDSEDAIYIARFYHPEAADDLDKLGYGEINMRTTDVNASGPLINHKNMKAGLSAPERPRAINHEYTINGDDEMKPSEVFNNESLTFIKLPKGSNKTPKVYKVNHDDSETSLEMFQYNDYIMVNGLHKKLNLRYKNQKVEIHNDKT